MTDAVSALARVCLPRSELRRALRIALLPPEDVPGEWEAWQSDPIPAEAALGNPALRHRRLFPLIDANLRAGGVPLDTAIKASLRIGAAHEKMRREQVDRAFQSALAAVDRKIEFLVLRGMALSSIYPRPFFRHCHDLDLLVHPPNADNAANLLAEAGFRPGDPPPGSDAESRWMVHPSGFPVGIHVRLVRLAPWNREEDWFAHSRAQVGEGVSFRTLQPEEMLAAVCVHAATVGSLHSPCWITDAWYLLAAHPSMDWQRVLRSGPALPLRLTLGWLREELGAPVPAWLFDHSETPRDDAAIQQATAAAMLCSLGRAGDLLRSAQGVAERLHWFRQLALPDARVLRWIEHSDGPSPVLHLRRLRRFARAQGVW
jgi:hypothetical protein